MDGKKGIRVIHRASWHCSIDNARVDNGCIHNLVTFSKTVPVLWIRIRWIRY